MANEKLKTLRRSCASQEQEYVIYHLDLSNCDQITNQGMVFVILEDSQVGVIEALLLYPTFIERVMLNH
jgi:hypothetical protein